MTVWFEPSKIITPPARGCLIFLRMGGFDNFILCAENRVQKIEESDAVAISKLYGYPGKSRAMWA